MIMIYNYLRRTGPTPPTPKVLYMHFFITCSPPSLPNQTKEKTRQKQAQQGPKNNIHIVT